MKKNKLMIMSALLITMSACKKDWNCDCTVTAADQSQSFSIPTYEIKDQSKRNAEEACDAHGNQYNTIATTLNCNLTQK
jgi:hypothetical protein